MSDAVRFAVKSTLLFGLFISIPVMFIVGLAWSLYPVTHNVIFEEPWMMPSIVCLSVFFGGVISRTLMNTYSPKSEVLPLAVVFTLAQIFFAALIWSDLFRGASLSIFLPLSLNGNIVPFITSFPCLGLLGMVFSGTFTLPQRD